MLGSLSGVSVRSGSSCLNVHSVCDPVVCGWFVLLLPLLLLLHVLCCFVLPQQELLQPHPGQAATLSSTRACLTALPSDTRCTPHPSHPTLGCGLHFGVSSISLTRHP